MSKLMLNIHKLSILKPNIHITSTCNNNTLKSGWVNFLEAEDKEEDMVMEEVKLYVIIMENHDFFFGTVLFLRRHVCTANILIIPSNNVRS